VKLNVHSSQHIIGFLFCQFCNDNLLLTIKSTVNGVVKLRDLAGGSLSLGGEALSLLLADLRLRGVL
jgi:hypothetical protein